MNGLSETQKLRLLVGPCAVDLHGELYAAICRLESIVYRWQEGERQNGSFSDAEAGFEGCRRLMVELRAADSAKAGGGSDAA